MRKANIRRLRPLDYVSEEALNAICSNLLFAGKQLKKIVITSCNQGEGKSYMCMRIAHNLAGRGKRVVLVDADMRHSALVSRYGIESEGPLLGLTHLLAGSCGLEAALYQTNVKQLYFIPAGREVANPVPLLNAQAFSDFLDYLARYFDVVLIDTPPVGMVIDAAEIAGRCDGAILLVKCGLTRRQEVTQAKRQIEQTGCAVLGCILNQAAPADTGGKKHYHPSRYGAKRA